MFTVELEPINCTVYTGNRKLFGSGILNETWQLHFLQDLNRAERHPMGGSSGYPIDLTLHLEEIVALACIPNLVESISQ